MGNQIDVNGYLSQLKWRPAIKLNHGEKRFLFQFLEGPQTVTSMHGSTNRKYEFKIKKEEEEDQNSNDSSTESEEEIVMSFSRGSLTKPAVRKRIRKLLKYGLIEKVALRSTTLNKEIINFNLRRAKPFKITEYALFCILSQEIDLPPGLFSKYWKSKVLTTLLSPYLEESSIVRRTLLLHIALVLYLYRACNITNEALNKMKEAEAATTIDGDWEGNEQERQDIIAKLKDDLEWHAKSFALRLLVDCVADRNNERRRDRIHILLDLKSDKKFSKLLDTVVSEVQSSYEGLVLSR
jgi:hypothetical protein